MTSPYQIPEPQAVPEAVPAGAGGYSIFNLGEIGNMELVTEYRDDPPSATRSNTPWSRLPDGGEYNRSVPPASQNFPGGYDQNFPIPSTAPGDPFAREPATSSDVSVTINAQLANLRAMSVNDPEAYAAYLWRLWAAGFLGSGPWETINTGAWSKEAGDAFVNAAVTVADLQANGVEVSFDDYLDKAIAGRDKDGDGQPDDGSTTPPTINAFTDPETLRLTVQSAAQAALGRDLSESEANAFLSVFRDLEAKANATANAAQTDTTGGTYDTSRPDASGQAAAFVESGSPTEADSYQMAGYGDALRSLLYR